MFQVHVLLHVPGIPNITVYYGYLQYTSCSSASIKVLALYGHVFTLLAMSPSFSSTMDADLQQSHELEKC